MSFIRFAGRFWVRLSCFVAAAACLSAVLAQPPGPPREGEGPASEGREGPPPPGREGPPPPPFMDPLRAALDANKDHRLDADEIKNAPEALAKLDKNGDGAIDHEELRPPMPPRPMGPPGEEGFRGPPREGGPEGGFRRPPRESGSPGEGRRGPDGPPAERGEFRRPGPGGPGGPGAGGPSPDRIVDHAMTFDSDGDGKLDRDEMRKFADSLVQRMRGGPPGGPGGDRGPRPDGDRGARPDGDRGPRPDGDRGPRPDGDRGPPEGGDRPERPRRPE